MGEGQECNQTARKMQIKHAVTSLGILRLDLLAHQTTRQHFSYAPPGPMTISECYPPQAWHYNTLGAWRISEKLQFQRWLLWLTTRWESLNQDLNEKWI